MTSSLGSSGSSAWRNLYVRLEEERVLTQNLIVGAGTIFAGLIGVAYQAIFSHHLTPADYGSVFTVLTLVTLIGFPAGAFTLLMARETSRDRARGHEESSSNLLHACNMRLVLVGSLIGAMLAIGSSFFGRFLGVHSALLLAAAPGLPFALALPLLMGEFQGQQRFLTFSFLAVGQAGFRLVLSIAFAILLGPVGIIAGTSVATVVIYLFAYAVLRRKLAYTPTMPWWRGAAPYLLLVLPSTVSIAVLLSSDVILVKHFFPASIAGEYAAVAALGRAIFWGASGIAIVLFPKVIFRRTQGVNGFLVVNASLLLAAVGGLFGLALLTVGSTQLLSAFAGPTYRNGAAYLPLYAIGMTLLGGVAVLNAVHQSHGRPAFLSVLIPVTAVEPVVIALFHRTVLQVVIEMDVLVALALVGLALVYVVQERVEKRASRRTSLPPAAAHERMSAIQSMEAIAASLTSQERAKRPLRILILNWRCPYNPRAGGAERLTHELARRLGAQGHTVEWFSSSFSGAAAEEFADGIRLVRRGNRWSTYWHAYRRYRRVSRDLFDVVIDEVNVMPFFAPAWCGLPTFMLIHQLAREIWWYEAVLPLNLLGYLLEPLYLRFYRDVHVLTVSSSTESDLRRYGFRGPITLIPEGVETIDNVAIAKPPDPTFAYVGRLVPSKRIEHILVAFAEFRLQVGAGRLWLVGAGSRRYEQSLVRLTRRLDLEESVVFSGHLPASDKHRVMAAAHALLMTSVREGWGLVVTEANACGTPAIVYDVPGLRDSVRHESTGLVVPPKPEKLAAAMIRLTTDADLYNHLVEGAKRWSQNLSFDETARVVGRALEEASAAAI